MIESNILYQDLYGNVTEAAHRIELLEAENDRLMAENGRLRSRVAELEGANARLRAALVEERAAKMHLGEWIDAPGECAEAGLACPWEEIPEDLEMPHRPGVFWKANYREKARAALSNPSETPISSGKR